MIASRRRKLSWFVVIIIPALGLIGLEAYTLSPDVRILGANMAVRIGATDTVAGMLDDPDHRVRAEAEDLLVERGETSITPLVRALVRLEPDGRRTAAQTLARIGPAAIAAIPGLESRRREDADPSVRVAAATAMSVIAPDDPRVIRSIGGMLSDGEERCREEAARILGQLGPLAAGAVLELAVALRDSSPAVRRESAEALGRIGPAAKAAVPALAAALGDPEAEVRMEAAEALGSLGSAAREAIPALTAALRETNPKVRSEVGEALAKIK